jgi:hypothetical protein
MTDATAFFAELDRLPATQREAILPVVIALFAERSPLPLDAALSDELHRFNEATGIDAQTPPDVAREHLRRHFAAHGVTDGLFRTLASLLVADPAVRAATARALLGTEASRTPIKKTTPSAGAVAAGPLARFSMPEPPKKR